MTLAFPDPGKWICVLADACDRFYAGLVTHIHKEQLDLPMDEQDHQPLAVLSGVFKTCNYDGQCQRRKVSLSSTQ
jgi:hypothetical protein